MGNGSSAHKASAFQEAYPALQPLILDEWPEVDAEALSATGGDLERVVALLAERTRHTRTLLRAHLMELLQIATAPPRPDKSAPAEGSPGGAGAGAPDRGDRAEQLLHQLEDRAVALLRELRGGMVESSRDKVRESPLLALLLALGLGFILGVIYLRPAGRGE